MFFFLFFLFSNFGGCWVNIWQDYVQTILAICMNFFCSLDIWYNSFLVFFHVVGLIFFFFLHIFPFFGGAGVTIWQPYLVWGLCAGNMHGVWWGEIKKTKRRRNTIQEYSEHNTRIHVTHRHIFTTYFLPNPFGKRERIFFSCNALLNTTTLRPARG